MRRTGKAVEEAKVTENEVATSGYSAQGDVLMLMIGDTGRRWKDVRMRRGGPCCRKFGRRSHEST